MGRSRLIKHRGVLGHDVRGILTHGVPSPQRRTVGVVVAYKQEIFRAGFRAILAETPDLEVVGETGGVDELFSTIRQTKPDVVLLESRLAAVSDAKTDKRLYAVLRSMQIVLIGSEQDVSFHQAQEIEAKGFLMSNAGRDEILRAIRTAAQRASHHGPEAVAETFRLLRQYQDVGDFRSRLRLLSPQERRILALMADGNTNKGIAGKMLLSEKTVKNYIANLFVKLDISRRTQAVAYYLKACPQPVPTDEPDRLLIKAAVSAAESAKVEVKAE
jgi:two-component system, NarL family, response regulator DevR